MKKQVISYFTFSKKELNGLSVLCLLIVLILLFPVGYRYFKEPETYDLTRFKKEIALFKASATRRTRYAKAFSRKPAESRVEPNYFEFDPNTLSSSGWRKLGLSAKQIKVLNNYRSKGGKFYKNEDLQKIYSIHEAQYNRLAPYIKIEIDQRQLYKNEREGGAKERQTSMRQAVIIELNAADSSMLETIRGVGPAFASRIIRYRTRLRGFYNRAQLMEVYGIDSVKYLQLAKQVSVDTTFIKKIMINTADFDDLKSHPYLTFKQINAVIQYRKHHGNYSSASDLKKVLILNDKIIRKIEPYLSFDP